MRFNEIHRSSCTLLFTLMMFAAPVDAQIFKPMVFWPSTDGGNDHFYQAVKVPAGISWTDADAMAISLGGHLATLTSLEENDWVFNNIVNDPSLWTFNADAKGPWIGGFQNPASPSYSEPNGGWEWVTGEAWGFTNWMSGQPDNAFPGEHYLHFFNIPDEIIVNQWNDIWDEAGFKIISFVVEYSVVTLHCMKMRRTVDPERNDQFFQAVVIGGGVAWTTARDMAEAMGGHLATLTSLEENDWVFNNIVNDPALWTFSNDAKGPWIGGFQNLGSSSYSEPNGGWEWVTGEDWIFTNWKSGQPDNAPPGEHYLHFFNIPQEQIANQWNDIWDDAGFNIISFVVEYNDFCVADTNKDRLVNVTDLLQLLAAWGACP
ncbi:MAG: hypothetical protein IID30_13900 [Planctomycetes bacterium]|nr:hypothetical protein [Planctomycetota bacterium]